MNQIEKLKQIPKPSRPALVIVLAAVGLISFLAGFVPMWTKVKGEQRTVANLEREAVLMQMEIALASATIEARGGRYEPARKKASQFFTSLRFQLDQGRNSVLPEGNLQSASTLLDGRDELITLLARGDPAGADRLAALYLTYRQIATTGGENSAGPVAGPAPDDEAPVGGSP